MIKIVPVAKQQPETVALLSKERQRYARQACSSALPVAFVAQDTETGETASLGFKYRRQSHHCELTWWDGKNEKLFQELAKALVMQAILEGRKRVEIFNERNSPLSKYEWPAEVLDRALEGAGFKNEGSHEDWTKALEDVEVYGHVWMSDGIPVLDEGTEVVLVGSGEVSQDEKGKFQGYGVRFYREKNLDLYRKDRDLYRQKEGDERTFAEHIADAIEQVESNEQVTIDGEWLGSPRKK